MQIGGLNLVLYPAQSCQILYDCSICTCVSPPHCWAAHVQACLCMLSVQSVEAPMTGGGAATCNSFLKAGLWLHAVHLQRE